MTDGRPGATGVCGWEEGGEEARGVPYQGWMGHRKVSDTGGESIHFVCQTIQNPCPPPRILLRGVSARQVPC